MYRTCPSIFGMVTPLIALVSVFGARPALAPAEEHANRARAYYIFQASGENTDLPFRRMTLDILDTSRTNGRDLTTWQMTVETFADTRFGVRLVSEGVPMTRAAGLGHVARYLYHDAGGKVFDYRDTTTGEALLPALRIEDGFLPVTSHDCTYRHGFASAGTLLGHVILRVDPFPCGEALSFDNPRRLDLRSDLLMSPQTSPCYDLDPTRQGNDRFRWRDCTEAETRELIDAGINFHRIAGPEHSWLIEEPVFFRGQPSFPDTFYRSNYFPGRMYIDEPSIRFGWNDHVPGKHLHSPEQMAAALRERVKDHYHHKDRKVPLAGADAGLDLHYDNFPSWDTHYFSAWQTLAASAPALVYEGRYRDEGYGWHPSTHFGDEGLEGLTFDDQVRFINAFLRGAARAHNGDWGTSLYHEGQQKLYPRAFTTAYDMGARYLWFWVHYPDQGTGIGFPEVKKYAQIVSDHAARHPRGRLRDVLRQATVGIVLPAGYIYSPGTIMSFDDDQVSPGGATYGEISSAAVWEGILCSQRGLDYDVLNDEPFIRDLGYERLIYVRPDGTLDPQPPWDTPRPATSLELQLADSPDQDIAARQNLDVDYQIPHTDAIRIDARFDDWPADAWIDLGSGGHGDLMELSTTVKNVNAARALADNNRNYLGFEWTQLDTDLQRKYNLQDFYIFGEEIQDEARPGIRITKAGVVITHVEPGSPADEAGLREGDVITKIHQKEINYEFQIHECLGWYRNLPELKFEFTRSGQERVGEDEDLRGRIALAWDNCHLYVAAEIVDDVHSQDFSGWDFWRGDSIQLGLDPILQRSTGGYSEQEHEIAFVLKDNEPVVWRYQGRRGQHLDAIKTVNLIIDRRNNTTRYEAAIPLDELQPMAPNIWPMIGFNVVVNDNDGQDDARRKGRLELRDGAMTRGKNSSRFAVARFAPSPDGPLLSSALIWQRRATPQGGHFRLKLALQSPQAETARITATLQSLDSPQTPAAMHQIDVPVNSSAREFTLVAATDSPPGRYALQVWVTDDHGTVRAHDRLPVYVYPAKQ